METMTPEMIDILQELVEISHASYILDLFILGTGGAILTCFLLYKFIKLFF